MNIDARGGGFAPLSLLLNTSRDEHNRSHCATKSARRENPDFCFAVISTKISSFVAVRRIHQVRRAATAARQMNEAAAGFFRLREKFSASSLNRSLLNKCCMTTRDKHNGCHCATKLIVAARQIFQTREVGAQRHSSAL